MGMFRNLRAEEIDCRVAQITKDGSLMLLLYKDARVDQKLLDEKFGVFGWQRTHELIGGNLYCTVSVKNPDTGEWISKQDVGTKSATEEEKGQASDSFKRACFNLGIGRELYTAPTIWVRNGDYKANEKGGTYDKFQVSDIGYDKEGNINKLSIKNVKLNKVVFTYGIEHVEGEVVKKEKKEVIPGYPARDKMLEVAKKHYPEGSEVLNILLQATGAEKIDDLTEEQLGAIYNKYGGR
jgi:hypothetical protein